MTKRYSPNAPEHWAVRLKLPAWRLDPDGAVLPANDSALAYFSVDSPKPRTLTDLITADDLGAFESAADGVRDTGQTQQVVCSLTDATGSRRRHLLSIQSEDDLPGLLIVASDISGITASSEADDREAAFHSLFLANPAPRWIYDTATLEFLEVNDAAVQHYGWSRAEFLSMTLLDIRTAEEAGRLTAFMHARADEALQSSGVWRHRRKNGIILEVEVTGHAIPFQGRQARAMLIHDVTERQRMERRLEAERARAVRILNSISDGFYSLDNEWRFTFVNDSAEPVLGFSAAELIGRNIWDTYPEAVDSKFFIEFNRAKLTDQAVSLTEYYAPFKSWIELRAYPHEEGLTVYFRDVTQRWEAERALKERQRLIVLKTEELEDKNQELRKANAMTRRLFENSLDVICLIDDAGKFVDVSPRAFEAWGYRPEELVGRRCQDFLVSDDQPASVEGPGELGREGVRFENRFVRKDGRKVVMQWSSVWSADDGLHFAIARDMTEREESEALLRRAQRLEAVGSLTGGVAHDFNNLLTVILGGAEEIAEELPAQSPARRLAETVRAAAERGADLTSRLLAFARQQPLEPRVVDINQLISEIDPLLRRTLEEDVDLEVVRTGGLWRALIDPGQLENAILNLCLNARDAMPAGGKITLETANMHLDATYAAGEGDGLRPGQYVMIAVADTGAGMTRDTAAKVFEPFFTTKPTGQGSGLGLSMVYGFVKQSLGHIRLYSELGEGTTVKLYLPRAHAKVQEVSPPARLTETGGTETILVVEDDDLVRNHVENQLRRLGYQVLVQANAQQALEALDGMPPLDLLFTDVVMPGGLNGRQLSEAIRERRPGIRVLFTSGYTENAIVHHGRLDPGVHLLSKPYRRAALAAKVRQVLDEPLSGNSQ